jgi:hypothetical protein
MHRQVPCGLATTIALVMGVPAIVCAQWTFAGYVGDTWTSSSTMTVVDAATGTSARIADVDYESQSWSRPLYWGVRAGRTVTRDGRWAAEFEYIHLKVYATPEQAVQVEGTVGGRTVDGREPFRAIVERFRISHGLNLLLVNVAVEQRVHSRLALVARGGIGPTLPHIEATIGGSSRDEYTWGPIGIQAAAAINWSLTSNLLLTGELKRTSTRQRLGVGSATAEASFGTTHLIVGMGIRLPAVTGHHGRRRERRDV